MFCRYCLPWDDSIHFEAGLNVVPLSEIIVEGNPYYLFVQCGGDRSVTTSRWTALDVQQVNRHTHSFPLKAVSLFCLRLHVWSVPVWECILFVYKRTSIVNCTGKKRVNSSLQDNLVMVVVWVACNFGQLYLLKRTQSDKLPIDLRCIWGVLGNELVLSNTPNSSSTFLQTTLGVLSLATVRSKSLVFFSWLL